jgi:5'-nucleotidase
MEYWLQGEYIDHEPVYPDNDTQRLNEGYASLVACTIDATNYALMETLHSWDITDL